jgi:hypothetical protein
MCAKTSWIAEERETARVQLQGHIPHRHRRLAASTGFPGHPHGLVST